MDKDSDEQSIFEKRDFCANLSDILEIKGLRYPDDPIDVASSNVR